MRKVYIAMLLGCLLQSSPCFADIFITRTWDEDSSRAISYAKGRASLLALQTAIGRDYILRNEDKAFAFLQKHNEEWVKTAVVSNRERQGQKVMVEVTLDVDMPKMRASIERAMPGVRLLPPSGQTVHRHFPRAGIGPRQESLDQILPPDPKSQSAQAQSPVPSPSAAPDPSPSGTVYNTVGDGKTVEEAVRQAKILALKLALEDQMLSDQELAKLQYCILSVPYRQKTLGNGNVRVFAKIEVDTKRLHAALGAAKAQQPSQAQQASPQGFSTPQRQQAASRRPSSSSKTDARPYDAPPAPLDAGSMSILNSVLGE